MHGVTDVLPVADDCDTGQQYSAGRMRKEQRSELGLRVEVLAGLPQPMLNTLHATLLKYLQSENLSKLLWMSNHLR